MTSMSNLPASPHRVVTVRDFLTDKHGFTLPASRLHSYTETLKHTSSSLFRHPKVFSVHYHASVFETDCHTPLEKDKWERGEYFEEGQTTVWAHFVRIPGVDIFGKALEKSGERVRHPVRIRRRSHLLRLSDASGDRVEKRTKKKERLLEGYSLPPPNSSPHPYYSQYTEIVPLPQEESEVSPITLAFPVTVKIYRTQTNPSLGGSKTCTSRTSFPWVPASSGYEYLQRFPACCPGKS